MEELTGFTKEQLEAELKRRKDEAVALEETRRQDYAMSLTARITKEAVDVFQPEHGRTSCSDTDRGNGFGSADYGPRCVRCALLDAVENGHWNLDFRLDACITKW